MHLSRSLLCVTLIGTLLSSAFADTTTEAHEMRTHSEMEKTITPNAMPIIQHGFNAYVTADFIYWTGRLDTLNYAHTGLSRPNEASPSFKGISEPGSEIGVDHKLSPGFKAGVGLSLGHDGWDTYFQYTWLHSHASSTSEQTTALWKFAPGSIFSNDFSLIGTSSGQWHLHFNTMDWELGREYFISPHLLLRPFIGLKGTWQRQTYNIDYDNISQADATGGGLFNATSTGSYSINNKQYFWGIGPRIGLNSSWQFNRNWGLFGDIAWSTLWSYFTDSRIDTAKEVSAFSYQRQAGTPTIVANERSRFHSVFPVLELALGARWDYWFLDDDYRIRIQAAWEEQVWFDQNHFIDGTFSRYGALTLQGLTLAFRLDF